MRLPEQKLYDWLRRRIGHVVMLERIENRVKTNTPDVYACGHGVNCWMELKVLPRFPTRPSTTVRLDHWTSGQRFWAMRHLEHGGATLLLLQVGDEVFVANAGKTALQCEHWTQADWRENTVCLHMRNANIMQILDALDWGVI